MNGSYEMPEERLCGCCEGLGRETPEPIYNRPARSQISYRVGRHVTFKASMLAALSDPSLSALASLRTRDDSDFSIALFDAWATILDILTFYQERLANESYLRTAVDSSSVMGLAQLVGYKPSPGVAASAFLAFTLSSAPGSPETVLIQAGSRVQSVPGPGQSPQVFETSTDLTARIRSNAIAAQTNIPWQLFGSDTTTWIKGTDNKINAGDTLLFISAPGGQPSTSGPANVRCVTSVKTDSASGNTQISWNQALSTDFAAGTGDVCIYVFRKKAALFGVQAPNPYLFQNLDKIPGKPSNGQSDWNFTYAGKGMINLDAAYSGLTPPATPPSGDPGELQWLVLAAYPGPKYVSYFQIVNVSESNPNLYSLSVKTTELTLSTAKILAGDPYLSLDEVLTDFTKETRVTTAYVQSDLLIPADLPYIAWEDYDDTYRRQPGLLKPVEGTTLEIVGGQQLSSGQPVAVFGKRLRLRIITPSQDQGFVPHGGTATQALSDGQIFLIDAFPPGPDTNGDNQFWSVLTAEGVAGSLRINPANVLLVAADKNDPIVGESVLLSQTSVTGPITGLQFQQPLSRIYDRTTVGVNANVVAAAQGETMHEILGSGDAANSALTFTLKQAPLTYISSPLGMGASSTLEVWVNNLQWHEVDNFLSSAPTDRVFVTRRDATGKTIVQFGDGEHGGRTPTGQMNLRAVYRKGLGAAGNVQAGQLSQALDRPQGLQGVTNPDPAAGGADPDSGDDARASAPLHVLTLDRVVSLEDYQNYARAFPGIEKALATWTWFGRTRGVFLTVAGADGTVFRFDDATLINLMKSLHAAGNPFIPVQVASYVPVLFEIAANIRVDLNDYDPRLVLGQVWQSLSAAFGFEQRGLGQGMAQSEIIALIQQTPGVIAAELTAFNRQGQLPAGGSLPPVLRASAPIPGQEGTPQGAEMLVLDPACQNNLSVWS